MREFCCSSSDIDGFLRPSASCLLLRLLLVFIIALLALLNLQTKSQFDLTFAGRLQLAPRYDFGLRWAVGSDRSRLRSHMFCSYFLPIHCIFLFLCCALVYLSPFAFALHLGNCSSLGVHTDVAYLLDLWNHPGRTLRNLKSHFDTSPQDVFTPCFSSRDFH